MYHFSRGDSASAVGGRVKTCQVGQAVSIYLAFTPNPDLAIKAVTPEGAHCARHYHYRRATNVVVAAGSIHRVLSFGILSTLEACCDNKWCPAELKSKFSAALLCRDLASIRQYLNVRTMGTMQFPARFANEPANQRAPIVNLCNVEGALNCNHAVNKSIFLIESVRS